MKQISLLIILVFVVSCSSNNDDNFAGGRIASGNTTFKWSIPVDEIFEGAGRDGIPSIENPRFLSAQNSVVDTYMNPEDLIIGLKIGDEVRAYPHKILDWHEIVNDEINGQKFTINYCPLTRTAFVWQLGNSENNIGFGVSGLLYNTNLILYDRATNSNWSQMSLECVYGERLGDKPTLKGMVETTWEQWKKMYPESKVLGNEQGFDRNYQIYPYGGYLEVDDFLFFPVTPIDNRLNKKERVYGILKNDKIKVYRFSQFSKGNIIIDEFEGVKYLLVGNDNLIKSFNLPDDLQTNIFDYSFNNSEEFFSDDLGNKWSIFGEVIEGSAKGRKLKENTSVTGFWFSLASFYPNPQIYE